MEWGLKTHSRLSRLKSGYSLTWAWPTSGSQAPFLHSHGDDKVEQLLCLVKKKFALLDLDEI